MHPSFDLSNKIAIVTGGSRGLGKAIALAFARAGADVMVVSRKLAACEQVADEVTKLGARALPFSAHVGTWQDNDRICEAAYAHFGRVDILVNNAGMSPLAPSLVETSESLIDKILDVNFKGPFRLSTVVAERMMQSNGGAIINMSSAGSFNPKPLSIPYACAKGAINVMTLGLARMFAPKVRVNCIAPGPFLTNVSSGWRDNTEFRDSRALKRFGEPNEIVGTAIYLASEASSYMTGQTIRVDGAER
jgi:NAD(P)-dependent dehydrogenase (short-subunit alcohol dehydrogenase family)